MRIPNRSDPLEALIEARKRRVPAALVSVCTANLIVIEACMDYMVRKKVVLCLEATANQVNQNGGYSGMRPEDYSRTVKCTAARNGFREENLLLGGDHLGPLVWRNERESVAMRQAIELVHAFVLAGFTKIHIDTTMPLGDDHSSTLPLEVISRRTALLVRAAEEAFCLLVRKKPEAVRPYYIVGSEVPVPGGARDIDESTETTSRAHVVESLSSFQRSFHAFGLSHAWNRVVGLVVQPGVEFDGYHIRTYSREKNLNLTSIFEDYAGLLFEGHSTDYQPSRCLRQMVEDGFAIIKVGPALTFALREALFALSAIEFELRYRIIQPSRFQEILEEEMLRNPIHWCNHYYGTEAELRWMRRFSLLDRSRYYLSATGVEEARKQLFRNLDNIEIPLALLSQYLPVQYQKVKDNMISVDALSLVKDVVQEVLDNYLAAAQCSDWSLP